MLNEVLFNPQDQGILLQKSCVYKPQQNGVAKRKNHHIFEVSHALLFERNVQKSWSDANVDCMLFDTGPFNIVR